MNNVDQIAAAIVTIMGAIITLAIISVLVSRNANTVQAFSAAGNFYSRIIAAAVNPAATAGTNGDPSHNAFSMPGLGGLGALAGNLPGLAQFGALGA